MTSSLDKSWQVEKGRTGFQNKVTMLVGLYLCGERELLAQHLQRLKAWPAAVPYNLHYKQLWLDIQLMVRISFRDGSPTGCGCPSGPSDGSVAWTRVLVMLVNMDMLV